MNKIPIVLGVDFDETIAINNPFPNIISFVKDADYYIRKLHEEGYYIIIWSCRNGEHVDQAKEFLFNNNVPFDKFNEHHPALIEFYGNNTRKISSDIYIDDKNLGGLPTWDKIYDTVKNTVIENPVLSFNHKTIDIK